MTKSSKKKLWVWGSIAVVGMCLLLVAILIGKKKRDQQLEEIVSHKVEEKPLTKVLYLTGRIRPKSSMVITPASSGHILEVLKEEGAQVKSGDSLFTMRLEMQGQDDLLRMRSELKQLQIEERALAQKVEEKASVQNLIASTILLDERNALEKVRNQLQTAQQRLAVIEKDLGLQGGVQGKGEKVAGERSVVTISAPQNGIVTLIDKQPGDFVAGGNRSLGTADDGIVMVLADMSVLQVRTKVLEADLSKIRLGQVVDVKIDALPGKVFVGDVSHVGGQGRVDRTAGYTYFDVDITLKSSQEFILPEMNANVEIVLDRRESTKVLPLAAVAIYPKRAFVLTADQKELPQTKQKYQEIIVGLVNEESVEILSGLELGQEVLKIDFSKLPLNPQELSIKDASKQGQSDGAEAKKTATQSSTKKG
jgi:HlyD family secretion protein